MSRRSNVDRNSLAPSTPLQSMLWQHQSSGGPASPFRTPSVDLCAGSDQRRHFACVTPLKTNHGHGRRGAPGDIG